MKTKHVLLPHLRACPSAIMDLTGKLSPSSLQTLPEYLLPSERRDINGQDLHDYNELMPRLCIFVSSHHPALTLQYTFLHDTRENLRATAICGLNLTTNFDAQNVSLRSMLNHTGFYAFWRNLRILQGAVYERPLDMDLY